jgi:phosphoribosylanthranilate isomerase
MIEPEYAIRNSFSKAASDIDRVAIFVNADDNYIERCISSVDANLIQLHGDESIERCSEIKSTFGLPVIKSFGISSALDLATALKYSDIVDYFLFDAKPDNDLYAQRGGLNKTFDWSILKNWKGGNYYLSGGLNENNINDAVNSSNPSVIDVSSGVESEPGLKDKKKIENFVKLTRLAYEKKL